MSALLVLAVCALALANGANDNVKGVATLIGAGRLSRRAGILYATVATLLGSAATLLVGRGLLARFSGKGLVPEGMAELPLFALCVGGAAAATVLLATRLGMPISTTHAIVGGLCGVGLAAGHLRVGALAGAFVAPLLVSPLLSMALVAGAYPLLRRARRALRVGHRTCVCVAAQQAVELGPASALGSPRLRVVVAPAEACAGYAGTVAGVSAQRLLDGAHLLTAGAVSFARGVNDTPKVAALLLLVPVLDGGASAGGAAALVMTGVAMALGGLLLGRRVARTMSHEITPLNDGQAFTANLGTAALVLLASHLALPVSTTHVSCGALFGIGAVRGGARWRMIGKIVGSWAVTLPVAGVLAAALWMALGG
jgi:PiT family inorganic phosphate transporter